MKKGTFSAGPATPAPAEPDSPFAKLAAFRDALPPAPPAGPTLAGPAPTTASKKGPAKAVVRLEKKGRGGKEVTLVEQLGLAPAELEVWLKALKGQLGCGGVIEGDAIVLQGDLRKRLAPLLESRGVRQVKIG